MSGTESVRVEQCDREAALKFLLFHRDYSDNFRQEMLRGERDASMTIQAFARHRIAAIEATTEAAAKLVHTQAVEWKEEGMAQGCIALHALAKDIRANKHLEPRHD